MTIVALENGQPTHVSQPSYTRGIRSASVWSISSVEVAGRKDRPSQASHLGSRSATTTNLLPKRPKSVLAMCQQTRTIG